MFYIFFLFKNVICQYIIYQNSLLLNISIGPKISILVRPLSMFHKHRALGQGLIKCPGRLFKKGFSSVKNT